LNKKLYNWQTPDFKLCITTLRKIVWPKIPQNVAFRATPGVAPWLPNTCGQNSHTVCRLIRATHMCGFSVN